MAKYAFWTYGPGQTPTLQTLHDSNELTEPDRKRAVAPPTLIRPEHENLSIRHLAAFYPVPQHIPIPKAKRGKD